MSDDTNVPATPTATAAPSPNPTGKKTAAKTIQKTSKPKAEPATKMVLRITAKPKIGFRRCGVHHPPVPVDYPADAFDAAQIAILKADASLVVEALS